MPDDIQLDTCAGLYMFKNFVWPNGKNFILTSVCIHTYIYVYVYLYMYESIDKVEKLILYGIFKSKMEKTGHSQILVFNIYPPCHTGGNNLEGLSKSVTIFTLGENHDLDCLPIDKISILYVSVPMYIRICTYTHAP